MKWLRILALAGVAAALLSTANASASTLWFSDTPTPTVANNPTIYVLPGANFTLYFWAQMSANQSFTGISLDVKVTTPGVVSRVGTPATSYSYQNPNNGMGNRWNAVGTGNAVTPANLLIDNANAVNINGSNMGWASPPSNDPTYNAATNSYLLATLDLVASPTPGVTDLFFGVGTTAITFKNAPNGSFLPSSTRINFGFGDAGISGNDSRRTQSGGGNANSTLADATIRTPEPSTFVLIGVGAISLIVAAKRRRS